MTNTSPHILIVDDDRDIRDLLARALRRHGFVPHLASDGVSMRRMLANEPIDLIVLDIMMPGEDGLSLCQALRNGTRHPVILLSALAEESDRVLGLELGADDYMTKPFSTRELCARIKAVLRRKSELLPVHRPGAEALRLSDWTLCLKRRELRDPDDQVLPLTSGEFDLLVALATNSQRVLSRDHLLEMTRGREPRAFDRSIDVLLSRLRRKLKHTDWIKTVRGGGYLFAADVAASADADVLAHTGPDADVDRT